MEQSKTITVNFKYYDKSHLYWLCDYNYIKEVELIDTIIVKEKPAYKCQVKYKDYSKRIKIIMEDDLYPTYDECRDESINKYTKLIIRNPEAQ